MSNEQNINIGSKPDFFAWLPNCIVYEWGLSAEALGVALYLHGKPAGWKARPFDIQKHFKFGDYTWRKVSKELKSFGLLHERKVQSATELWFELPDMDVRIKKPSSQPLKITPCENHTLRKPTPLANKDLLPKKDLLTDKDTMCISGNALGKKAKNKDDELEQLFAAMWKAYPHKKGKQEAYKALVSKAKAYRGGKGESFVETIKRSFSAYLAERDAQHQLEKQGADIFISQWPLLSTWINKERWMDEFESPEEVLRGSKRKKTVGVDLAAREERLRQEGFII